MLTYEKLVKYFFSNCIPKYHCVACCAELVETGLVAVWADHNATCMYSISARPARKESNVSK
jgi:hypothetical protein